jgi:hypothetical protein
MAMIVMTTSNSMRVKAWRLGEWSAIGNPNFIDDNIVNRSPEVQVPCG